MTSPIILALEASCDDTGVTVMDGTGVIIANFLISHLQLSVDTKGIVPERQARAHLTEFGKIFQQLTAYHNTASTGMIDLAAINLVAATAGPGLIGGLLVATTLGRSLAWSLNVPYLPVNHLAGHVLSVRLASQTPDYPYLALLITGGHSQLLYTSSPVDFTILGQQLDDAVGEVFDKVASLLGLGFPGGARLERLAANGDASAFSFPRPLLGRSNSDFSFSGLKSAVRRAISPQLAQAIQQSPATAGSKPTSDAHQHLLANIAASFQAAVCDCLADRLEQAIRHCRKHYPQNQQPQAIAIVGGVAANRRIRSCLQQVAASYNLNIHFPPPWLCSDNSAMIAWAGLETWRCYQRRNLPVNPDLPARPRWPIDLVQ